MWDLQPLLGLKKAGKSSVSYPMTGTPRVSRYSRVRGMSRMLLAPAQTTATGVLPSSVRSEETSHVCSAPLCTPPIPPVTNTSMPARLAMCMVPLTVVAPWEPLLIHMGRSRTPTFGIFPPPLASSSSSPSLIPTFILPPRTQIDAGTAPLALTSFSTASAVSKFWGHGIPWAMMVLSSATTALPSSLAALTSSPSSRSEWEKWGGAEVKVRCVQ
mmetsp:Transcript_36010/g.87018  ORF Transcript_36010/g.87018 Transcript_36010/m.87018 type:complete len:215 (-) Transcript_36010:151-795(-)